MSFFEFSSTDIEALAKLLTPPAEEEQPQDAVSTCDLTKPTAASVGPKELLPVRVAPPRAHVRCDVKTVETAWETDEDNHADGRIEPEYEFRYKQSVTTSDNFLGMSGKDPSSTCCDHLVVVVQLPQATSVAELELDTTCTQLRLVSPCYKLRVCFPHKVDSERGTAKWDSKKKLLSVILPIVRRDPFT